MNQTDPIADLRAQNDELKTQIQNLLEQVAHLNKMLSGTEPTPKQQELDLQCDCCKVNQEDVDRLDEKIEYADKVIREAITEVMDEIYDRSITDSHSLKALMIHYSHVAQLELTADEKKEAEKALAEDSLEGMVRDFFENVSMVECRTRDEASRLAQAMRKASKPAGTIRVGGRTFVYKL